MNSATGHAYCARCHAHEVGKRESQLDFRHSEVGTEKRVVVETSERSGEPVCVRKDDFRQEYDERGLPEVRRVVVETTRREAPPAKREAGETVYLDSGEQPARHAYHVVEEVRRYDHASVSSREQEGGALQRRQSSAPTFAPAAGEYATTVRQYAFEEDYSPSRSYRSMHRGSQYDVPVPSVETEKPSSGAHHTYERRVYEDRYDPDPQQLGSSSRRFPPDFPPEPAVFRREEVPAEQSAAAHFTYRVEDTSQTRFRPGRSTTTFGEVYRGEDASPAETSEQHVVYDVYEPGRKSTETVGRDQILLEQPLAAVKPAVATAPPPLEEHIYRTEHHTSHVLPPRGRPVRRPEQEPVLVERTYERTEEPRVPVRGTYYLDDARAAPPSYHYEEVYEVSEPGSGRVRRVAPAYAGSVDETRYVDYIEERPVRRVVDHAPGPPSSATYHYSSTQHVPDAYSPRDSRYHSPQPAHSVHSSCAYHSHPPEAPAVVPYSSYPPPASTSHYQSYYQDAPPARHYSPAAPSHYSSAYHTVPPPPHTQPLHYGPYPEHYYNSVVAYNQHPYPYGSQHPASAPPPVEQHPLEHHYETHSEYSYPGSHPGSDQVIPPPHSSHFEEHLYDEFGRPYSSYAPMVPPGYNPAVHGVDAYALEKLERKRRKERKKRKAKKRRKKSRESSDNSSSSDDSDDSSGDEEFQPQSILVNGGSRSRSGSSRGSSPSRSKKKKKKRAPATPSTVASSPPVSSTFVSETVTTSLPVPAAHPQSHSHQLPVPPVQQSAAAGTTTVHPPAAQPVKCQNCSQQVWQTTETTSVHTIPPPQPQSQSFASRESSPPQQSQFGTSSVWSNFGGAQDLGSARRSGMPAPGTTTYGSFMPPSAMEERQSGRQTGVFDGTTGGSVFSLSEQKRLLGPFIGPPPKGTKIVSAC